MDAIIIYHSLLSLILLFVQKTYKQRIMVGVYFSLLFLSPFVRDIFSVPYEFFYMVVAIIWGIVVCLLEDNKARRVTLITALVVSSHLLYAPDIIKIIIIEASVYAFFWKSKLSVWVKVIDTKLNKWRSNVLHKVY